MPLGVLRSDHRPPGFRRVAALQEGLRRAVAVPLALAETVASLWPALRELALCASLACRSDLQVRGGGGRPPASCCRGSSVEGRGTGALPRGSRPVSASRARLFIPFEEFQEWEARVSAAPAAWPEAELRN